MDKTNVKKRGRKPKGGKIIEHSMDDDSVDEPRVVSVQNVILHLKCFRKDVEGDVQTAVIEPYSKDETFETVAVDRVHPERKIKLPIPSVRLLLLSRMRCRLHFFGTIFRQRDQIRTLPFAQLHVRWQQSVHAQHFARTFSLLFTRKILRQHDH